MPNPSTAFGLIPRRHASGSHYNAALNAYYVPASDATPLYRGDPVLVTGAGDAASGCAVVTRAGATGAVTGVVVGFGTALITTGYRPASTAGFVLVNDDPDALYEIMDNGTGTVAIDGGNANMVVGAGNAYTRQSGFMLDSSTIGTAATLQLKIMRGQDRTNNDLTIANGTYLVKINNSAVTPNSTGF